MAEFAFGADGAAVGEHDVLGDGEAEAGAAGFAGAGFVDAVEAFEEARQMLGGDAGAEILHVKFDSEFDAALAGRAPSTMRPPERPYFMALSIRLEKTWWMASRSARTEGRDSTEPRSALRLHDLQFDFLAAGDLAETFFGVVQEFDGRNGFGIEAGLAGFDARQSQQVFGEARHAGGVLADDFEKLAVGSGIFGAESRRVSEYP